ncbi:MAG TPA: PQQ-binding-like beta-propeller repeat protein, partial [Isosphaeraceae bacterium]|nr:PQQ-binding-like beta-propeller repeat protein [Isosphaeraceae bacterium]
MATLEIHDDAGRVQRVSITRDHPALFGSSPECDIILKGSGILPVHGRIRFKGGRYKVDAAPEAQSIERNGKPIASGSFRIGDEVRLGPFRIFMVNPDDGPLDEKTRVMPQPTAAPASDKAGWIQELERPSIETAVAGARGNPIDSTYDRALQDAVARRVAQEQGTSAARGPWWKRMLSSLTARDDRPGQERILTSPLVIGLAGAFVVLVVLGFSLRGIISRTAAQRQYNHAVEILDAGDYRNAIVQFDEFMKANPEHPQARKAKVLRAMANVQQYAIGATPSWKNALLAARAMVTQVGREPAYGDESTDLADLVLKTAEGLADKARTESDAEALKDADDAVALHAEIMGKAAAGSLGRSRVPGKLDQARSAVRKSATRLAALAAMDAGLKDKSAAHVYTARDGLVAEYSDMATDRAVVDRLTRANDLIRSGVKFDESRRPAETEPNPEALSPPLSFVLRTSPGQKPANGDGPIIYALADGFAYGLDGGTGAPLWHIPVGLSSPINPVNVLGGDPAVLVFDSRHNELCRIDGRTGKLVWRQGMEEAILSPPLILGNQAIQATPSGKLRFLDLRSGELTGTLNLDRPLAQTPAADEAGQFFYVLGDAANLFLIKRDPLSCTAVEYTGHGPGSLLCPPARIGRYLIMAENTTLGEGRWTLYELMDEGAKLRPVQHVDVPGWTWSPPASQGSVIWALGDRGGPIAFSIGEEKVPLQVIAKLTPDNRPSGPAFARTRTEREVWISSSYSGRFDLNAERQTIAQVWSLRESGPALAPIQVAGRLAVFTQQNNGAPGVALWGVDPTDGSVKWKTILGAPWPLELGGTPDGASVTTLATDGSVLTIARDQLLRGGFIEQPLPKPGSFSLPPGPVRRIDAEGVTYIVPSGGTSQILVREGSSPLRTVNLPAPLGAAPLLWGSNLMVPGGDSRVYLIDPKNGASMAEPYVPPFDRDHPIRWRTPARLDDTTVVLADEVGTVRRLAVTEGPNPKLEVKAEVDVKASLLTDPVATEAAILLITSDGKVRALASRDLSPVGSWELEAP